MSAKTLSIITPSYQQDKYISDCISSVIFQEGDFYIDYIVIDGGSTDGSVEKIRQFEQMLIENCDKREVSGQEFFVNRQGSDFLKCSGVSFQWVSEPDAGQADGINKGLSRAIGDFFGYLNSDDVYEQGAFETVLREFEANPEKDVVYGNAFYINENNEVVGMYPPQDINKENINVNCVISQPSAFVRMSAVEKFGQFNKNFRNSLDYEYWLRLWHGGAKFLFIRPVLSSTRLHDMTKTRLNREAINMESFAAIKHYNGNIPWKAKAIFALETSVVGKLSYYMITASRLWQKIWGWVYAPIYFLYYKNKVEDTKEKLFDGPQ